MFSTLYLKWDMLCLSPAKHELETFVRMNKPQDCLKTLHMCFPYYRETKTVRFPSSVIPHWHLTSNPGAVNFFIHVTDAHYAKTT